MNIMKNQIFIVLVTYLMITSSEVFALGPSGKEVIWQADANVYFKYADQDEAGIGKNDHPVELSKKEMTAVLQSLKIQDENDLDLYDAGLDALLQNIKGVH